MTRDDDPLGLNSATEQPPEFAMNQLLSEIRTRIEAEDIRAAHRRRMRYVFWVAVGMAVAYLFGWLIVKG